jgi:protein LTV1
MPKKKFISGSSATYSLLPSDGSGPSMRWLRTDGNVGFQPFSVTCKTCEDKSPPRGVAHESDAGPGSNDVADSGNEGYDYDRHLRVIGADPAATFFPASKGNSLNLQPTTSTESYEHKECSDKIKELIDHSEVKEVFDIMEHARATRGADEFDDFFDEIISTSANVLPDNEPPESRIQLASKITELRRSAPSDGGSDDVFDSIIRYYDASSISNSGSRDDDGVLKLLDDLEINDSKSEAVSTASEPEKLKLSDPAPRSVNTRKAVKTTPSTSFRTNWDCETVISTFSAFDNHPKVLRARRDKVHHTANIIMSTSVEAGTSTTSCTTSHHSERFNDHNVMSNEQMYDEGQKWRQNICRKGESKEEKKVRKAAVKVGRRQARLDKKYVKDAFKQAEKANASNSKDHSLPLNVSLRGLE